MINLKRDWEKTLKILKEDINKTIYTTWFLPLSPKSIDETKNILYVEAENKYVITMLNNRYLKLLEGAVENGFEKPLTVIATQADKKNSIMKPNKPKTEEFSQDEYYLNPRFNFDSFVVGNNAHAFSTAKSVAENPSTMYNPFFLYGGSGLGKTHLMHSIGHYILKHNKDKKVLYISSEMFTNDFISAIRKNKTEEFKQKYRNVDVLLIDDIQFIEGKESTQEEFFHTFNDLYDRNKQIVISSDRHPHNLTNLNDRLRNRFLWNLYTDLQPPDYETRVSILLNKAETENIEITADVIEVIQLISERIKTNVRELEGAFTRIISFSTVFNKPIDLTLAKDTLKDILSTSDLSITIDAIKKIVCKYFSISIKDMDSSNRTRKLSDPRQIAMYLSKEMTDNSFPSIGKAFGGRDHTTVIHAHKKISNSLSTDQSLKLTVDKLSSLIEEKQ